MAYEPRKAAQLIAALILKTKNKRLNVLKAVKLVYLIDREGIRRHGFPVLDEPRCSMRLGPVNSYTYDFIKGEISPPCNKDWADFISDRDNHEVGLAKKHISVEDLDELSKADIECIDAVWAEHGDKSQWELVDWTHNPENIPEWQDPNGSSLPIPLKDIVCALKLPNAEKIIAQYEQAQAGDNALEQLRGGEWNAPKN